MPFRILVRDGVTIHSSHQPQIELEVFEGDLKDRAGEFDALIIRSKTKLGRDLLLRLTPRLKVIGRAGVGVDNIDLAAAGEQGITVVNAPASTTIAVAEHTLGLMLSLARQLPYAVHSMRRGRWEKKDLRGTELSGKVLGIIGFGRIGSAVAQRASIFGMQVIACDPYIDGHTLESSNIARVDLWTLLGEADFVSLHVPINPSTIGLIGLDELKRMKPSAYLINTARGDVLDEAALVSALDAGHLRAAALDVFSVEPPGIVPVVEHPKVICTPHLGAQTREAQLRAGEDILAEVIAALQGEPLRWRVA